MKNTLTTMMAGAATVAAVTAGSAFMAAPAEALSFGDTLDFSTDADRNLAKLTDLGGGQFEFSAGDLEIDATSAFGMAGTKFTSNPITLQQVTTQVGFAATYTLLGPTPVTWLTGLDDGSGGNRTFDLVSFTLNTTTLGASTGFNATLNGFFNPPGVQGLGGVGGFGSLRGSLGSTISGEIEVVPTPAAVLPGLIGMGTAVFRKKKQEDGADVAVEPAEANA